MCVCVCVVCLRRKRKKLCCGRVHVCCIIRYRVLDDPFLVQSTVLQFVAGHHGSSTMSLICVPLYMYMKPCQPYIAIALRMP